MSTIVTDTLQGKTTATSITLPTTTNIGATPLVSASANSMTIRGEGSAVTNIQQGLIKCWCNLNGKASFGLRDSFSVSSAVDEGTGNYDIRFTNNMGNSNYSSIATGDGTGVATIIGVDTSLGRSSSPTTFCTLSTKTSSSAADLTYVYLNIAGDLA